MKYIIFLTASIFLLATLSCKKFLDTTPTDFITPDAYYSTPAQLQIALNGVYDRLGAGDFYGAAWVEPLNWSTDESCDRNSFASLRTYDYASGEPTIYRLWKVLYDGINRANSLLAYMDKVKMDQKQKDIIKGQALFLRGYYYFMLVSNWSDVPLILKPTEQIISTDISRSSTADVYTQIVKDMTEAEGLLSTQTASLIGFGGKISVSAVQGILARVNLYMASYPLRDVSKYSETIKWAKKIIDSNQHELNQDYKQIFINYAMDKYDVKESIWEVEFFRSATDGPEGGRVGNSAGPLCNDANIGTCYSTVNASGKLFYLYGTDASSAATPKASFDQRRDWNCANYTWGAGAVGVYTPIADPYAMSNGKFRREYEVVTPKNRNSTPINFPILRYADVLLMLAEAENEVNNAPTAAAYDAINKVRARGYGILRGNVLKTISMINQGTGYSTTAPPTVVITGGGGTGATGKAIVVAGKIVGVNITNRGNLVLGSYYTSAPTITFTGGGGTGAIATATITTSTDANLPANLNHDAFLAEIQNERARELSFEALRRSDLIRWNIFIPTMKSLVTDIQTSTTTAFLKGSLIAAGVNISSRHTLFPIPIREISLNKALTQNPQW
jgi:starch-binding outer membrane protein, SusD/RagB family